MPDYDLGTARGKIEIDASGAERGYQKAQDAQNQFIKRAGAPVPDGGLAKVGGLANMTADQLNEVGGTLQRTGLAVGGVGVAMVGALGLAVKSSANFEKTISAIGAVSDASGKQLDQLRKKALQIGADTQFSAAESAQAMEELSKAGLSVEDILNGAAIATANLAAAGGTDLPTAAAIASSAMNQFKLAASDLPRVADLIAGSANASAIDVNDFGMAMNQAGIAASTVGLSFDDLALAITAMGKQGLKGSDAGTSLKTMLLNLQPQTTKQIALFEKLGLSIESAATAANPLGNAFFDANGKIKSMTEIADTLKKALKGMSEQQKLTTLETLFGTDAIRAAALVANQGAEGMDSLAKGMEKVKAADVAKKRMDNLSGAIEQLKGSIETMVIQTGGPFQEVGKTIVGFVTKIVNAFGSIPGPIQKIILYFVAFAGSALALAGAGSFIIGTFLKFAATLRELKAAFAIIKEVQLLSKAMSALNAVLALNPFVLIIAAIVALGVAFYALYKHSEGFRKFIDSIWQGIQKAWDAILNFFKAIPDAIGKAFGWLEDRFTAAIDWIKKNWDILLTIFTGPIGAIVLVIRRFGGDIVDFFKDLPGKIGRAAKNLFSGFIDFVKKFPGNVLGIIKDGIKKIVGLFLDLPGAIVDAGKKVIGGITGFFKNALGIGDDKDEKKIKRDLDDKGKRISGVVGDSMTSFTNRVRNELSKRGNFRDGGWFLGDVRVGSSIGKDGKIILDDVKTLRQKLGNDFDKLGETPKNGIKRMQDAVRESGPGVQHAFDGIRKKFIESVSEIAKGTEVSAKEVSGALAKAIKSGDVKSFWSNLVSIDKGDLDKKTRDNVDNLIETMIKAANDFDKKAKPVKSKTAGVFEKMFDPDIRSEDLREKLSPKLTAAYNSMLAAASAAQKKFGLDIDKFNLGVTFAEHSGDIDRFWDAFAGDANANKISAKNKKALEKIIQALIDDANGAAKKLRAVKIGDNFFDDIFGDSISDKNADKLIRNFLITADKLAKGIGASAEAVAKGLKATVKSGNVQDFWDALSGEPNVAKMDAKTKNAVSAMVSAYSKNLLKGKAQAQKEGRGFWEGVADTMSDGWNAITGVFTNPGKLVKPLQKVFDKIIDGVGSFITNFVNFFVGLPGKIAGFISRIPAMFGEMSDKLVRFISSLPQKIGYLFGLILGNAIRIGGELISKAIEIGKGIVSGIVEFVSGLPAAIASFFSNAVSAIVGFLGSAISAAISFGSSILNGVINFISRVPGEVGNFVSQVPARIAGFVRSAASAAMNLGRSIFNGIIDFVTSIPQKIWNIITSIPDMISRAIGKIGSAAKNFGSAIWNGFKDGMGINSPSYIEKAMFAVVANASKTTAELRNHVVDIQKMSKKLPVDATSLMVAQSSLNITPASVSAARQAAPAAPPSDPPVWQFNGPLIENATIRDNSDVVAVSRSLAERLSDEQRSQGRKVLS